MAKPKTARARSRARETMQAAIDDIDAPIKWPPEIKRVLELCSSKQRHMAICLASGMAEIPAYRRAYNVRADRPDRTMHGESHACATHPYVLNARSVLEDWIDRAWLLEAKDAIEFSLDRLYELATESSKEATQLGAVRDIMRYHGAFVSRSEVRHIHSVDTSSLDSLLSGVGSLLGVAVSIPIPQIEQADVANKRLIDAQFTVSEPIGIGTDETDTSKPDE